MGKVFTEREIEEQRAPKPDDFAAATEAFRESVTEGLDAGLLDGGVIFGSVAINAATIRSDLDCMIIPVDHSHDALTAVQAVANRVFDYAMDVPFNAAIHHRSRLASGEHEFDRFFGAHLSGPHRIVQGNDPKDYMHFSDASGRDTLLSYVRHKKRGIGNSVIAIAEPERYKGYQRLLELPVALGRKTLMVLDEIEGTNNAVSNSADKTLVFEQGMAVFEELGVADTARLIQEHDQWYTEELVEALESGNPNLGYVGYLEELDQLAVKVSPWLDELDQALQRRLPKE